MSENCERCPLRLECEGTVNAVAGVSRSLAEQRYYLELAAESAQIAETFGAFAILSGEITAEDHEKQKAERDRNPNFIKVDYDEKFADLDRETEINNAKAERVASLYSELGQGDDVCQGPTLGVVRSMMFRLRVRPWRKLEKMNSNSEFADELKHERAELYDFETWMHGKCSNPAAKKVKKALKKIDN